MWPLQEAQRQMATGERLVWADSAIPIRHAIRRLPTTLLYLPFFFAAILWVLMMSKIAEDIAGIWFLPIYGMIFVVASLGVVLSPLWSYAVGLGTVYAVTDRRLMILRKFPRRVVLSYEPKDIGQIVRRERSGGRGDVIFREVQIRRRGRTRVRKIGFFGVHHVRRVEEVVRKLKDGDPDLRWRYG